MWDLSPTYYHAEALNLYQLTVNAGKVENFPDPGRRPGSIQGQVSKAEQEGQVACCEACPLKEPEHACKEGAPSGCVKRPKWFRKIVQSGEVTDNYLHMVGSYPILRYTFESFGKKLKYPILYSSVLTTCHYYLCECTIRDNSSFHEGPPQTHRRSERRDLPPRVREPYQHFSGAPQLIYHHGSARLGLWLRVASGPRWP